MIRLSYTALADYMTSSAATQRKTLFDYKYADEDEPRAKILYYREARDAIRGFHVGHRTQEWLAQQADPLEDLASIASSTQRATRLRSNARTLRSYAANYTSGSLQLRPDFRGVLNFGGVEIRVVADLHGIERRNPKVIRLDHSRQAPDRQYCSIVTQLMFESARNAGIELPTSSFVVRHIASRTDFKGARAGARIWRDIEASCENIEAIWLSL